MHVFNKVNLCHNVDLVAPQVADLKVPQTLLTPLTIFSCGIVFSLLAHGGRFAVGGHWLDCCRHQVELEVNILVAMAYLCVACHCGLVSERAPFNVEISSFRASMAFV